MTHLPDTPDIFPMLRGPVFNTELTHLEYRALSFCAQIYFDRGVLPKIPDIAQCLRISPAAATYTVEKLQRTGSLTALGLRPKEEADESD